MGGGTDGEVLFNKCFNQFRYINKLTLPGLDLSLSPTTLDYIIPSLNKKIIISKLIISVLLFQLVDILHYDDYIHMHDNMLHV